MDNSFLLHYLGVVAQTADGIDEDLERIKSNNVKLKTAVNTIIGVLKYEYDFPDESIATVTQSLQEVQTQLLTTNTEYLDLTEKEISKMPKQFRKEFRTNGLRAHVRKRTRGNSTSFEIRCRRNGLNISVSGSTLEEAKLRFIRKLEELQSNKGIATPDIPTTFDKFVIYYFETFRKRKVKPKTYSTYFARLRKHILPCFGSMELKNIPPQMCQELIDRLIDEGKGKTAEEIFSLLNCTFKAAIKHNIITHNPLDIVFHVKHKSVHGTALSIDDEKKLLAEAPEPYKTIFALSLFTGLRPNELHTAHIVGEMIVAKNSERHGGKEETKRIPITPMLRPYISDTIPHIPNLDYVRNVFNETLNHTHKLYDLRTTFYTRCKMCGVAPAARAEFMGHSIVNDEPELRSSNELDVAYTDLPDDYLIKEGQKLNY